MVGFPNDSATVTRALEQLENGTPAQKISAIEALGRSRDRRVPPALTRALADSAVWNRTPGAGNHPDYVFVARSASKSLVRIGAAAVPALIGALARDECVDLPVPCVEVSFEGCFYIGDHSFDRVYVAQLAAQALARIGRPAKPALYHVLALIADARPAVREAARSAALVLAPGELDPGPVDLETLLAASVDRGDEGERTKWTRSLRVPFKTS